MSNSGTHIVYALHDFDAEAVDEISFRAGDQITVLETDEQFNDNWWKGQLPSGQIGLFPSTYTTPDRAVMLASRSAFAAVPGGDDDDDDARRPGPSTSSSGNNLMGNTMAELDNALKQMRQRNSRDSYAGTDFSVDNDTELGDEDGIQRGDEGDDGDEGEDYLATQSSAARAALALRAKSNALSATEKERIEAEQRKAAAQKRLEEEEERQRALLLQQHPQNQGNADVPLASSVSGLQRKPTVTSSISLKNVEVSDESDSENGEHGQPQKRTDKGKGVAPDIRIADERADQLRPLPSAFESPSATSAFTRFGNTAKERGSSEDTAGDNNSILSTSRFEAERPSASFGEVAKLQQAVAEAAAKDGYDGGTGISIGARAQSADTSADTEHLPSSSAHLSTLSNSSSSSRGGDGGGGAFSTATLSSTENGTDSTSNTAPTSVGNQTPPQAASEPLPSLPQSPQQGGAPQQKTPTSAAVPLPPPSSPSAADLSKFGPGPEGDPTFWTVEQVAQWGRSRGWDEASIVSKFIEHEITGDVLLEMDVNILREIDILAFGKRFQVASAIKELKKRAEGGDDPTAGAAAANGWTVSRSPTPSASTIPPGPGSASSTTSSPLMSTLQREGYGGASLAPESASPEEAVEVVGVSPSPPSNETQLASVPSAGVGLSPAGPVPTSPSNSTAGTTTRTATGLKSGAPLASRPTSSSSGHTALRGPRVSFSQTVEHVPPPASHLPGSPFKASSTLPKRLRSPTGAPAKRGVLTNAHMPGNPAWPTHLVTIASGQGIGNVYADRRDSRSTVSSRARDSLTAVPAPVLSGFQSTYGSGSGSGNGGGAQYPQFSGSGGASTLPPGGGTYPPPLLVRKPQSAVGESAGNGSAANGGAGSKDKSDASGQARSSASSSGGPSPAPSLRLTSESREGSGNAAGRAGDRTSFFASLTSRARKPAPRMSQLGSDAGSASGQGGDGSGSANAGTASSTPASSVGKGFAARFKKQEQRDATEAGGLDSQRSGSEAASVVSPPLSADGHLVRQLSQGANGVGDGHGNGVAAGADDEGAGGNGISAETTGEKGESVLAKIRPVDLEGWLSKKGERYGSWKSRYVALKGPDLVILRGPEADKIKGYISMKGYRVIADANTNPGKYGFQLISNSNQTHSFSSDDPLAMREWVRALMKSTIGRDNSFPVISSYNNKTISLREAQAMYPPPRPPSPDSCLRVQRANIRANPNSLSAKDAAILTGLLPQKAGSIGSAGAK